MLNIATENDRTGFEPGATVPLLIDWELETEPERLEVRLFWHTEGRGDTDGCVVQSKTVKDPGPTGRGKLALELPESPYSFSGRLVSLIWSVELVALPRGGSAHLDLVLGPDAREVRLQPRVEVEE